VGQTPSVYALNDEHRSVDAVSDMVWEVGTRPVFTMTMASGRRITATAGHRFKCFDNWNTLGELKTGDRVAIVRKTPQPKQIVTWPDELVAFLGQMIGDGSYLKNQPLRFSTSDSDNAAAFKAGAELLGCTVKEYDGRNSCKMYTACGNRNGNQLTGIRRWLADLGIYNQRGHEKHIPSEVFSFSTDQLALLLRHLWATDGSFCVCNNEQTAINYSTTSRRLADEVACILTRFGIIGRINVAHKAGYRDTYIVQISGGADQLKFCRSVGAFGRRIPAMKRVASILETQKTNTNVDTLPVDVWLYVRQEMLKRGVTTRKMAELRGTSYGGSSHFKFAPSRETTMSYAAILDSDILRYIAADNDVFWDVVKSIEPAGEQVVYDLTVPSLANWQANGIITHNSGTLEQDSALVMMVYRPEYYKKNPEGKPALDDPERGLMEVIVAKNRFGGVGTAKMRFTHETTAVTEWDGPLGGNGAASVMGDIQSKAREWTAGYESGRDGGF
jgi:replicative DNA helicase